MSTASRERPPSASSRRLRTPSRSVTRTTVQVAARSFIASRTLQQLAEAILEGRVLQLHAVYARTGLHGDLDDRREVLLTGRPDHEPWAGRLELAIAAGAVQRG